VVRIGSKVGGVGEKRGMHVEETSNSFKKASVNTAGSQLFVIQEWNRTLGGGRGREFWGLQTASVGGDVLRWESKKTKKGAVSSSEKEVVDRGTLSLKGGHPRTRKRMGKKGGGFIFGG